MVGDFADGGGHTADVFLAHRFVDDDAHARLQDAFGVGAGDLRIVHRGEALFLQRPAPGEEAVLLEDRVPI